MTRFGLSSALLSGAGVLGSALGWLLSFKIIAYWLGPEGVGLFALLRQYAQTATLGATFGGTNVLVQGIASRKDPVSRMQFRRAAAQLIGIAGLGVVMMTFYAAPYIARWLLASAAVELVNAIQWMALVIALNILATYLLGLLNGYSSLAYLALAQFAGPVTMAVFLSLAVQKSTMSTTAVLICAFVLCFTITAMVGFLGMGKLPKPDHRQWDRKLSAGDRGVLNFAFANLIGSMSSVAALLVIRSWIIEAKGLAFSGLFEAGWTLTFNYATLFLTACNTIYLPLLASASDEEQQRRYVLKTAYLVLGSSLLICYGLVLWNGPLIHLFYSAQFDGSGHLLSVLVIAVVFRSISWTYGTLMLAARKSTSLIASELLLSVAMLTATRYALDSAGSLEAIGWAFVAAHLLYLVFIIEYVRLKNPLLRRRLIWPLLAAGTVPLIILALTQGNDWSAMPAARWLLLPVGLGLSLLVYWKFKKLSL